MLGYLHYVALRCCYPTNFYPVYLHFSVGRGVHLLRRECRLMTSAAPIIRGMNRKRRTDGRTGEAIEAVNEHEPPAARDALSKFIAREVRSDGKALKARYPDYYLFLTN